MVMSISWSTLRPGPNVTDLVPMVKSVPSVAVVPVATTVMFTVMSDSGLALMVTGTFNPPPAEFSA